MRWIRRLLGLARRETRADRVETSVSAPPAPTRTFPPPALTRTFPPPDADYRFIALDVETARPDMWSICQIGMATVAPDGEVRTYSTLTDPNCGFAPSHVAIHGIEAAMVRGKPDIFTALDPLLSLLDRHPIIQHSSFDQRAIEAAYLAAGQAPPRLRWHDSVRIARTAWPEFIGAGGHGLRHLKQALALDFRHHDAGEDARAAALVVLQAEQRLGLPFDQILAPARKTRRRASFPAPIALDGATDGPLTGQRVVFTGQLTMSRSEAAGRAAALGMAVRTSVSRTTTFVVVGQQDLTVLAGHARSSKHRRAEELAAEGASIRIIDEDEFMAMVGEGPPPAPLAAEGAQRPAPTPVVSTPSEVVVFATQLAEDVEAQAIAAGMMVMTNVTNRTTLVVVADDHMVDGKTGKSTRHRSAEARVAEGQPIRILGETGFLEMIVGSSPQMPAIPARLPGTCGPIET